MSVYCGCVYALQRLCIVDVCMLCVCELWLGPSVFPGRNVFCLKGLEVLEEVPVDSISVLFGLCSGGAT